MQLSATQSGEDEWLLVIVVNGGQVCGNVDGPSQDDVIEQQLSDSILVGRRG